MRAWAPIGAVVQVGPYTWDSDEPPPDVGDFLVTRAGSAYHIVWSRRAASGEYHYRAVKTVVEEIPAGARRCTLQWARRGPMRAGR